MPGRSAEADGETSIAVFPLRVTVKLISLSARFPCCATQPFEPPTLIVASATRGGTGDEAARSPVLPLQEPPDERISPAAPGCWPPNAIRSMSTRMGNSQTMGRLGDKAERSDAEAVPLSPSTIMPSRRHDALPFNWVSAPVTAISVVNARLASEESGAQAHRIAWPCAIAASPLQTVPDTASQIFGSSVRSKSSRAGRVATKVSRYVAIPSSVKSRMRRLRTALGGAI